MDTIALVLICILSLYVNTLEARIKKIEDELK